MNTPTPARPIWMNRNELSLALGRSAGYVSAMKRAGFKPVAPPNCYTFESALAWLAANPGFRSTDVYPRKQNSTSPNVAEQNSTLSKLRRQGSAWKGGGEVKVNEPLPAELIDTTEMSRRCRVPFPTLYMALLEFGYAPVGIVRHKTGGFTPMWDASGLEEFCEKAFGSFPAKLLPPGVFMINSLGEIS